MSRKRTSTRLDSREGEDREDPSPIPTDETRAAALKFLGLPKHATARRAEGRHTRHEQLGGGSGK